MTTIGKRVLVVEDDAALRRVLVDRLQQEGFSVFEAADGIEGLEIAPRAQPHVILLDVLMPRMDGISMLTSLRAEPWGATSAVIILTNAGDAPTIARAAGLGVSEILVKAEWGLDGIVERIRAHCKS